MQRHGFTLLETMIALGIFMSVLVMVTQATIGAHQQFSLGEAEDHLFLENESVLRTIRDDLITSGWEIPDDQLDAATGRLAETLTVDRQKRYFPYILLQAPNGEAPGDPLGAGLGTQFAHARRTADLVAIDLPALVQPGTAADRSALFGTAGRAAWLASWHARSQEMLFLKINLGAWSATPWSRPATATAIAFNGTLADWKTGNHDGAPGEQQDALGILQPCGWQDDGSGMFVPLVDADLDGLPDEPYGVPLDSAILDPGTLDLRANWKTMTSPDFGWRGSPSAYFGPNPADYREYLYAVVPSPFGLGRLVRAVKVPDASAFIAGTDPGQRLSIDALNSAGMVVDKVLSDDVVRVVFDTYRTTRNRPVAEQLAINQVRVRLFLARRSTANPDLIVTRIVESVVTMRAKLSKSWSDKDGAVLGPAGIDMPY